MPVKVLLRGFAPDIPEDQPVTFTNDLPKSVLCVQCDNVSSVLLKDPHDHGYCASCVGMCTTEGRLSCSSCDEDFDTEELVVDGSTGNQLNKKLLICPRSSKSEPVEIPFKALKAHLNGCCCGSASGALNSSKQDDDIQPKAENAEEPTQPSSLQSLQMHACPICKETMPKKLIQQHFKSCKTSFHDRRGDSLQDEIIAQQESMRKPAEQPSKDFAGPSGMSEAGPLILDTTMANRLNTRAPQVDATTSSLCELVYDHQTEIAMLKQVIEQKNNDIELLKETVTALQEDIRSVQIRCENRIAKAEKSSQDLQEQRSLMQEYMNHCDEERRKLLEKVQDTAANIHSHFENRMYELQHRLDEMDAKAREAKDEWKEGKAKNRRQK